MDITVANGVNIYQRGSDPPLPADQDCPEWSLTDRPKTSKQLHQLARDLGGYNALNPPDYFRLVNLERNARIKASNAASRKRQH